MSLPEHPSPAAELLRDHYGDDVERHGIRDHGPLRWAPREPDHGRPLDATERAREQVLARRRVDGEERRRRQLREASEFWREVAA